MQRQQLTDQTILFFFFSLVDQDSIEALDMISDLIVDFEEVIQENGQNEEEVLLIDDLIVRIKYQPYHESQESQYQNFHKSQKTTPKKINTFNFIIYFTWNSQKSNK